MPEQAPAFQFYPRDFLASSKVASMTMEERGVYVTLLCFCWMDGSIPDDVEVLAKLCGLSSARMKKVWATVSRCFSGSNGKLRNPRLESVRSEQQKYREMQAQRGMAGAQKRWHKHGGSNGVAMAPPSSGDGVAIISPLLGDSSASASASASAINTPPNPPAERGEEPVGFTRFWGAYPSGPGGRKGGRTHTCKIWKRLKCEPMADAIIAAVKKFAASPDWLKDNGQFIPGAATWLNQRRWEAVEGTKPSAVPTDPESRRLADEFVAAWKRMAPAEREALAGSVRLAVSRIDEAVRWQTPPAAALKAWQELEISTTPGAPA